MRWAASLLACAVFAAGIADAAAAKRDKKEPAKDASAKPALVSSYGDWKVYHSATGKTKICYVLAEPKKRDPQGDGGEKSYAFISERPAEHVRNEVSFVMGFELATAEDLKDKKKDHKKGKKPDAADSAAPTAEIGDAAFDLAPTGGNLWVKNPAEEGKVIDEMRKGASLVVKAASRNGRLATLTYSLAGFSQAIDKAIKDCPSE